MSMIIRPAKGVWFVPSQHRYTEGHEQEVYPGKLAGQSPKQWRRAAKSPCLQEACVLERTERGKESGVLINAIKIKYEYMIVTGGQGQGCF